MSSVTENKKDPGTLNPCLRSKCSRERDVSPVPDRVQRPPENVTILRHPRVEVGAEAIWGAIFPQLVGHLATGHPSTCRNRVRGRAWGGPIPDSTKPQNHSSVSSPWA